MSKPKIGGLTGVIAGQSEICTVGQSGVGLHYRGYSIKDLAENASFEEVAYLLIYGKLPNQKELNNYQNTLVKLRSLPEALKLVLEQIPKHTHPMDVLRSGCSFLGCFEPETSSHTAIAIANRLMAVFQAMLFYWYHFHKKNTRINVALPTPSAASYFLQLLHDKEPDSLQARMLDVSMILYAEHGFNASTFAARITTSTLSDFYSAVCSAIGALRGPLHGGANEEAYKLIHRFKDPNEAEIKIKQMLERKELIMGFGHRIYKISDPRSAIIKVWSEKLSTQNNNTLLFSISERIEKIMWEERRLFPNLDFYSALAYASCDIPMEMFTPLFVVSRITGWAAHIMEQRANNKLIRPISEYIGPTPRAYMPLNRRQ